MTYQTIQLQHYFWQKQPLPPGTVFIRRRYLAIFVMAATLKFNYFGKHEDEKSIPAFKGRLARQTMACLPGTLL